MSAYRTHLLLCAGAGCITSGCVSVKDKLYEELQTHGLKDEVRIVSTGCIGSCDLGPIMIVYPDETLYARITPGEVPGLVEEHFLKGRVYEKLLYKSPETDNFIATQRDFAFFNRQQKIVLENCGLIDPENIEEYIGRDGYLALGKILTAMAPEQVISEVKRSGLRGRGGAGFPTGVKWELMSKNGTPGGRYVVCNADEGDLGAFMDRAVLEGDPHRVIEAMAISGYAVGASQGYVYVRAEYPLAIKRLRIALQQAREYGFLGKNIFEYGFNFDIDIRVGAGAFVCGEETALMASIMGQRGMPRPRPPFPAQAGLWGKPTTINNVETFACICPILRNGSDWFASIGTEKSKGTKVFALAGKIYNTGLIEVPMGTTLREIVYDIGGGVPNGKRFKAAQTGGPSGGCIPAKYLDVPVDYDSLQGLGSIMGSGGLIVMDEDSCMVDVAKFFVQFCMDESCGKCPPCRVGTQQMYALLNLISEGEATLEDLDKLEELCNMVRTSSLCGLGQTAPNPILSTLRYFRDEYVEHIEHQWCPAGKCRGLVRAGCVNACPAGVDVPSYLALVAEGKYAEALEVHRARNPFAAICGRVCPAFCEQKCRRAELDSPVSVRQVKRFMEDAELMNPWTPRTEPSNDKKVAIVGSGPAGLTAALRLSQKGYDVTVHEALPMAGGMMAVGIPEYRLPKEILQAEIDNIKRAGVEIRLNSALGSEFTIEGLMNGDGCHAVILAIGAHENRRLGIPGEEMTGVVSGTAFLRDVSLGIPPRFDGQVVAVCGGGDVAIDAARTALRLGAAKVHILYRRTREEMPAHPEEIAAAEGEGAELHFLVNPVAVLGDGRMTAVRCQRMTLGDYDESGRRRPVPATGTEFDVAVDVLIPAIGQVPDTSFWGTEAGQNIGRGGTVSVDGVLMTSIPGVFATGDAVMGPATVVDAVAQGNRVAAFVDAYLQGCKPTLDSKKHGYQTVNLTYDMEQYAETPRAHAPELDWFDRASNFREVEMTLPERVARIEARRCLRCDLESGIDD